LKLNARDEKVMARIDLGKSNGEGENNVCGENVMAFLGKMERS
jgi:hypothetical protein